MELTTLYIIPIESPIGILHAGASENGICFIHFAVDKQVDPDTIPFASDFKDLVSIQKNVHLETLTRQLEAYFDGRLHRFDIPLQIPWGTEFQHKAWAVLNSIPYGQTISYQEQARRLGNINAVRAVAGANNRNPIPIVRPCHRVIGKNGSLTGFGGGLWRKQYLLDQEQRHKK